MNSVPKKVYTYSVPVESLKGLERNYGKLTQIRDYVKVTNRLFKGFCANRINEVGTTDYCCSPCFSKKRYL